MNKLTLLSPSVWYTSMGRGGYTASTWLQVFFTAGLCTSAIAALQAKASADSTIAQLYELHLAAVPSR